MKIQVAKIVENSVVDGPGQRTVLFVAGCPIRCPGCQSPKLQSPLYGTSMDVHEVVAKLLDAGKPITISGGEPFAQSAAVALVISLVRLQDPQRHIIVYSGYTLKYLTPSLTPAPVKWILHQADTLVDGPYVAELDTPFMQWRGSSNQRPIDLPATMAKRLRGNPDAVVVLDWDIPTLTITEEGGVTGAAGTMHDLFDADDLEPTRMCGSSQ